MIKLTNARTGKPIWINPRAVWAVEQGTITIYGEHSKPNGEKLCTCIHVSDESMWEVEESPEQVATMVEFRT
jgi:hypothetical protein